MDADDVPLPRTVLPIGFRLWPTEEYPYGNAQPLRIEMSLPLEHDGTLVPYVHSPSDL
jgi:hypothetical protein